MGQILEIDQRATIKAIKRFTKHQWVRVQRGAKFGNAEAVQLKNKIMQAVDELPEAERAIVSAYLDGEPARETLKRINYRKTQYYAYRRRGLLALAQSLELSLGVQLITYKRSEQQHDKTRTSPTSAGVGE